MGTFNYVVQQIQQWSMYIHKNTLNFDYYKFTFFCNRALTTWHMFSNRLFLEGLNMKRAIFLLICAIEKQGFLIPSLFTGQHTAPNVPSPSIPLCLTWSSSQWPFQYTWLWHCCSGVHPNICVEDSCQDVAMWLSARNLVTAITPHAGPVQFMNKTKALKILITGMRIVACHITCEQKQN